MRLRVPFQHGWRDKEEESMKDKLLNSVLSAAVLVALTSTAIASTTWYVNGVSGSDSNDCQTPTTACKTIRHAIALASSGDSIKVAAATYTESLTINKSLRMVGSGASTTIIDGGGGSRVVTISRASAHVTLSGITIRNGFAPLYGGGISNLGTLGLVNSTVSGNTAVAGCTENCIADGGGIYNQGTLTINKSTLSGNTARAGCGRVCSANGGGIFNQGTLTINNSTLSGNSTVHCCIPSVGYGGAIYNHNGATLTVNNSTLSRNSGSTNGGGIYNGGKATLQNSIVANNSRGNCSGATTSNGYNLSSDGTCNFTNSGDRNGTDPQLGPLQNNGGPTQTMALPSGSPAVDAGNPSGCTDGLGHLLKTDQRGKPRPDTEDTLGCDMGAYERQSD
jgi:hypothetical protein